MTHSISFEEYDRIKFTSLQRYLVSRSWSKRETNKSDISLFTSPNDDPSLDLLLPLSREYADFSKLMHSAIVKIAKYENRPEIQVYNDLTSPPSDIVRYKADSEFTKEGIIPLSDGFNLLESARKSLLTTASDLVAPTTFHKRMSYKTATQFIDACYLGQSERGSYIASIVCPFIKESESEKAEQLSLFSTIESLTESFTRKVTKKLMSSIHALKLSIEQGSESEFLQQQPVSLNFLESIVELNELTQKSTIEISTNWSFSIPMPESIPNKVIITNDYIEPIKSIIESIKPNPLEEQGEYVGKISQISADPDVKNRDSGEIQFIFIDDNEKAISAKLILYGDTFNQAIQAFKEGKNIKIIGILTTQGRQRIINSPSFSIL